MVALWPETSVASAFCCKLFRSVPYFTETPVAPAVGSVKVAEVVPTTDVISVAVGAAGAGPAGCAAGAGVVEAVGFFLVVEVEPVLGAGAGAGAGVGAGAETGFGARHVSGRVLALVKGCDP